MSSDASPIARGLFVVLEGPDGCGKSTQVPHLAAWLRTAGRQVIESLEPGGTALGRGIRDLVLGDHGMLDARAEALLVAADRAQHTSEVLRPTLEAGVDVVSDRYVPSSLAYQGRARGLGVDVIRRISGFATDWLEPDLVVVLDVPEALAAGRVKRPLDRLEREGLDFRTSVRAAYGELAARFGWVVVDGTGSQEEVTDLVVAAVSELLGERSTRS